jgi:glycosyltransferase involved in cell wall biosynthesis
MKILQIAPLWETVPPPAYGGTEAVVSVLTEELVRRGHQVTLSASGDSRTRAELLSVYPHSLRTARDLQDPWPYAWLHSSLALREASEFDIIHNHAGELTMAMAHLIPDVPMLSTMHCLITTDTKFIWDRYPGYYNTISMSQRRNMPPLANGQFVGVVYNAIDVRSFPYDERKDDYLLFLSRISVDKMPHLAVEVARRTGRRLIIAGKVDRVDEHYFNTVLAPLIDGRQVQFLGEADAHLKRELYAKAYCLVLPLSWEEPFGLVMIEAMACGTPVVSFGRGAAPEVIVDGETGYIVNDVDEMVDAVQHVDRISPRCCRQHVEDNFDASLMANRYLQAYQRIIVRERAHAQFLPAAADSAGVA